MTDAPISATPQQQAFASACGDAENNLSLRAVAGSGKTSTLLLGAKQTRGKALALAFNKRNAEDLQKKMPENVTCKTLNGLGHGMLRAGGIKVKGVNTSKIYQIVRDMNLFDELDRLRLDMSDIMNIIRSARLAGIVPSDGHGAPMCKGLSPDDPVVWQELFDENDVKFSPRVLQICHDGLKEAFNQTSKEGLIDYDDQLYYPVVARFQPERYDFLMVDEAQDLSLLQHEIVSRIAKHARTVCAGDPRQSIYAWRGALPMADLEGRLGMEIMPLTYSFRCPQAVVRAVQFLVPEIQSAPGAPAGHVEHITKFDASLVEPGDAIICRNNKPLVDIAFKLMKAGVAVQMQGRSVGSAIGRIMRQVLHKKWREMQISTRALQNVIEEWVERELEENPRRQEQTRDRADTLFALLEGCGEHNNVIPPLISVVEQLDADRRHGTYVTLSSIHRAKGLEWRRVWFLEPGLIDLTEEQEQNCYYVAGTRAMEHLVFVEKS